MTKSRGPLYDFRINNIRTHCNTWAYDDTSSGKNLLYASVIGAGNILRGIRATFDVKQSQFCSLTPIRSNQDIDTMRGHITEPIINAHKMFDCHRAAAVIKDLHPTQSNLIVWARQPDEDYPQQTRYALALDEDDLPTMFLQYLLSNTSVMALPQWAPTIYQFAIDQEIARPLISHNIHGCAISNSYDDIMDFISDQLKERALPISQTPAPLTVSR